LGIGQANLEGEQSELSYSHYNFGKICVLSDILHGGVLLCLHCL